MSKVAQKLDDVIPKMWKSRGSGPKMWPRNIPSGELT
jgi:hypothetical protein